MRKQLKFVSILRILWIKPSFTKYSLLFLNLFLSEISLFLYLYQTSVFSSILHINLKVLWDILVDFVIIRRARWTSIRWSPYFWSYYRFEKDLSYLKVSRKTYNKHTYDYDCDDKTQQTESTKQSKSYCILHLSA